MFASEMKAIFASNLVVPKLNAAAFDPLIDQEPGHAQFPFVGIGHVPPASYLLVDLKTGMIRDPQLLVERDPGCHGRAGRR